MSKLTMKFRLHAAAIALYVLSALLFSSLFTSSSREKDINSQIVSSAHPNLLQTQRHNILSLVINEFLTCKDIIVLRQTCNDFQYLLHPNDAHMVTFCVYGPSKTMTNVNIIWEDVIKNFYFLCFSNLENKNTKHFSLFVKTKKKYDLHPRKHKSDFMCVLQLHALASRIQRKDVILVRKSVKSNFQLCAVFP